MSERTIQERRDAALVEECAKFIEAGCGDSIEDAIRVELANDLRERMTAKLAAGGCRYEPSCRELLSGLIEKVDRLENPSLVYAVPVGPSGSGTDNAGGASTSPKRGNVWNDEFQKLSLEARRKAPWPDFTGKDIYEGDTIRHPAGGRGVVVFYGEWEDESDQWRVKYDDRAVLRLCCQIGDKGQAVVIKRGV